MIFGLFNDKETIKLSKDLAVTFLEIKRALKGLSKEKLSEKNIISAFGSMKPYPLENLPFVNSVVIEKLSININIKHQDLYLTINPKFTDSGEDYKNYQLHLQGINDYSGFAISYEANEVKPMVTLLDTSKFGLGTQVRTIKPTKKSKILFKEFVKMKKFFDTQKI